MQRPAPAERATPNEVQLTPGRRPAAVNLSSEDRSTPGLRVHGSRRPLRSPPSLPTSLAGGHRSRPLLMRTQPGGRFVVGCMPREMVRSGMPIPASSAAASASLRQACGTSLRLDRDRSHGRGRRSGYAEDPDVFPVLRATETTTSARSSTALDLTTYAEAPAACAASLPSSPRSTKIEPLTRTTRHSG
jgi:hypothetical protein